MQLNPRVKGQIVMIAVVLRAKVLVVERTYKEY
jgi:hypothetical protein